MNWKERKFAVHQGVVNVAECLTWRVKMTLLELSPVAAVLDLFGLHCENLAVLEGSIDREFEMACGAVVMLTHGKERIVELKKSTMDKPDGLSTECPEKNAYLKGPCVWPGSVWERESTRRTKSADLEGTSVPTQ